MTLYNKNGGDLRSTFKDIGSTVSKGGSKVVNAAADGANAVYAVGSSAISNAINRNPNDDIYTHCVKKCDDDKAFLKKEDNKDDNNIEAEEAEEAEEAAEAEEAEAEEAEEAKAEEDNNIEKNDTGKDTENNNTENNTDNPGSKTLGGKVKNMIKPRIESEYYNNLSDDDKFWLDKYLKYKSKYIELKNR